jgi:hypothetical protein
MIPRRFNLCAVCGHRHGPSYDFRQVLAHFGLKGERATVACIQKLWAHKDNSHAYD